ncbi:MAG: S41 family peptidase [Planctomycetaceae bacterium]
MSTSHIRLIGTLACGIALAFSNAATFAAEIEKEKKDADYYELMKTFVDTFEQVERNYVKDVDRRELMEAAIQGMIGKLDPYSSYISPEELTQFSEAVEQEFGGIGIQVQIDPQLKRPIVMTPLPGTPAYKAGVKAGDIIMEIEGKSTEDFKIEQVVKLLKGKPGEEVTIGITHSGLNNVEKVKIVRDIIHVATVMGDKYKKDETWDYLLDPEKKIGYIRLTHFSRRSAEELTAALDELVKLGMKGLILDLRFNPGGLLSQATEISDMFIESGKIVSTKGRNTPERSWDAKKEGTYSGFPMVVLVNHFSASASEIVSACLQDHKRAVIVGDRTWGKGSVQNVIELESGSSALKLTTASYHRPSGKNIHRFPNQPESEEWGVSPDKDQEVKLDMEEIRKYLEYRKDRDVLSQDGPPKSDFKDRQLDKGLEILSQLLTKGDTAAKPADGEKQDAKPVEASKPTTEAPVRLPVPPAPAT